MCNGPAWTLLQEAIEQEVAEEVAAAVAFAEVGTWEPVEDLLVDVGAEKRA